MQVMLYVGINMFLIMIVFMSFGKWDSGDRRMELKMVTSMSCLMAATSVT